jgi:hypothetical protein
LRLSRDFFFKNSNHNAAANNEVINNPSAITNSILAPAAFQTNRQTQQPAASNRFDMLEDLETLADEDKNFGRTRSLLDPAQLDDLERKRKMNLQHKREIEQQIAEKNRIKSLEDEVSTLSTLKIENEAKRINTINQLSEQVKRQNPQYKNLDNVLATNRNERATIANVMNPEKESASNFELDNVSARGQLTQTRATETFKKMQEAELAAAEEKHKKLLKRLKHGGHDTSALERKFQELKARLTGQPIPQNNNSNNNNNSQPNLNSLNLNLGMLNNQIESSNHNQNNKNVVSNRHMMNQSSMSMMSEPEQRLSKEKNRLERMLLRSNENDGEDNNDGNSSYKMRKILEILREDPEDMPAELNEEQLRYLLKSVARNNNNNNSNDVSLAFFTSIL